MGLTVQIPTSLEGVIYRTMQKLSKAVGGCVVLYERANGTIPATTNTTSNTGTYTLEDTIEIDTGYVPLKEERVNSRWEAKILNVAGTFNGTDTAVGFRCIPLVSPVETDSIIILVNIYGKNMTDYANLTADWVLQELDR